MPDGAQLHGDHCAHAGATPAGGADDKRRLIAAILLTGVICVAEAVGGLWAGSLALLSDAGHMLTDVSAQLISLFALLVAARPATDKKTFGYRRMEILAALGNGVLLIGLAGFTLWTAAQRISAPPPVRTGIVMPVAAIGLVANGIAALLLHDARSLNVRGAYLHILSDLLSSVAVLVGGAVMWWRGGLWAIDPALGLTIGLFVLWSAARLVRDAVDVLLEAVPASVDLEALRRDLGAVAGVRAVHDLHVWTIGGGVVALSAHVVAAPGAMPTGYDRLLAEMDQIARARHGISHTTIQIESDRHDCAPQAH
jgi:cobalt-zinc-cadmium efflux system protein